MSNHFEGMSPHEMMRERKQLFVDAVRQKKKPKRVPLFANIYTWKIVDSKYKLSEALYDDDIMYEICCQHHEKYGFDTYGDMGTRNKMRFTDVFGKDVYPIDDELYGIQYPDSNSIADVEDYPTLLEKGYVRYYFEHGIARKYNLTDTEDLIKRFGPATRELIKSNQLGARIKKQYNEVYGVPDFGGINPEFASDYIFKAIRGMKGFCLDLRRHTKYIEQTLEMLDEYFYPIVKRDFDNYKERDSQVFAARGTSLVCSVLNPKQFEQYLWPYIKRYGDILEEKDLLGTLFLEGSCEKFADYLRELPKGRLGLILEQDDPVVMKEKLPNLTMIGGFPSYYLARLSVDECLDKAKEFIDKMAYDGNYIFSADKMLSYPADAKAENYLALNNFLKEYAVF